MEPSTAWKEVVEPGEQARFDEAAARIAAFQRERAEKYGPGRALHRKQITALAAKLEVLGDLPAHAAHGLFAVPGEHDAWIRLSNGSMDIQSDRAPDIRGFAIKVHCPEGDAALGGKAASQDFLLIDRPVFGFARPEPFFDLVLAASRGVLPVVWLFVKTYGPFAGLARLRALQNARTTPFTGFLTETFWSAAPIACGPYAVRVRLRPEGSRGDGAPERLADDVASRITRGPVELALELQFFVDEAKTPIEDGSVEWDEAAAPYVKVARLEIPKQDPASDEGLALAERVEAAKLDPWSGLAAHRPLGAIMRARGAAYLASQKARGG